MVYWESTPAKVWRKNIDNSQCLAREKKSNVAGHKREIEIAVGQVISLDFVQTSFLSQHDLVRVCKNYEHENCLNKIFVQNFHLIF